MMLELLNRLFRKRAGARSLDAAMQQAAAYVANGRWKEAIGSYRRILDGSPDHIQALYQLGKLSAQIGDNAAAIANLRKVIRLDPSHHQAYNVLGTLLRLQADYAAARDMYERALTLEPDNVQIQCNLGALYAEEGDSDRAVRCFDEVLHRQPGYTMARWYRCLQYLANGDFVAGWRDYESRFDAVPVRRPFTYAPWDGSPLSGRTLLVYGEQGLGDEIMFASCLPDVMRQNGRVVLECDARLAPLFRRSFPGVTVHGRQPDEGTRWLSELEPVDVQIALGSLPQHCRRRAEDFPRQAYLRADPARVEHWRQRLAALGPGRKVGISWRGGTVNSRRKLRSIPLAQWLPILQQPGAQFVSLQYTDCRSELAEFQARHDATVHHWQEAIDDYDETAALVGALDLVVSVQTSVVHLAGALGRKVWVIVPTSPEWRYGNQGETMLWYADVHLIRQRQAKDWQECIDTVSARLRQYAQAT